MSLLPSTCTEQLPTLNSARSLEKQGKGNQEDGEGGRRSALPSSTRHLPAGTEETSGCSGSLLQSAAEIPLREGKASIALELQRWPEWEP